MAVMWKYWYGRMIAKVNISLNDGTMGTVNRCASGISKQNQSEATGSI